MFSNYSVNCVFNIIEYFSYLNFWLVILFIFVVWFFIFASSTQLINSSRLCSNVVFETWLSLFLLLVIFLVISPALIILLDSEIIGVPNFMVYSVGYQWSWLFNICCSFVNGSLFSFNYCFSTSEIHLITSYYFSINGFLIDLAHDVCFNDYSLSYMFSTNELIILPIDSIIKFYVFSYDVIHSLGIYSFGIKIDAIPSRFNITCTIHTNIKGEHRGMCYELCGLGHSSMLIISLSQEVDVSCSNSWFLLRNRIILNIIYFGMVNWLLFYSFCLRYLF